MVGRRVDLDLLQQFAGEQGADSGIATNCWFADVAPTATTAQLLRGLGGLVLLMAGLFVANSIVSRYHVLPDVLGGPAPAPRPARRHLPPDSPADDGLLDKHESGDIMSRLINDTDTINQIISWLYPGGAGLAAHPLDHRPDGQQERALCRHQSGDATADDRRHALVLAEGAAGLPPGAARDRRSQRRSPGEHLFRA